MLGGFWCVSVVVGGAWRESLDGLAAPSHSAPRPKTFNHDPTLLSQAMRIVH